MSVDEEWIEFTTSSRLKVLRAHNPFASRYMYKCRRRLVVNVYKGCLWSLKDAIGGRCLYCYAISTTKVKDLQSPKPKGDFKAKLDRDIEKYNASGFPKYPTYLSSNTDPCQLLEERYHHTLYALKKLGEHGYPIVFMTKNPEMLLRSDYIEAIVKSRTVIQVTIPFIDSRFEPRAPHSMKRIYAVKQLVKLGFMVVVRLDPLVPTYGDIKGQSVNEIELLIEKFVNAGVKHIISKSLHLINVKKLHSRPHSWFYEKLKPLYLERGFKISRTTMLLNIEERRKLLKPVHEVCVKYGIKLFTCSDPPFWRDCIGCDGVEEILGLHY
ncbi:MAG: DUF1848 family protein [Nitrososphaerales archaeon]